MRSVPLLAAFALLSISAPTSANPAFVPLGHLPGGRLGSTAGGISADGATVVGDAPFGSGQEAFRWNGGVMTGLGNLPGGSIPISVAVGVSADGATVVGFGIGASGVEAFRWTAEGGMVGLGHLLPGENNQSIAYGVSADGATVVGRSASALGIQAFRWTAEEGMVGLGDLPGGRFLSLAQAVTPDGAVVVGSSDSTGGEFESEAFRWEDGVMTGIGDLAGGRLHSYAHAVTPDGSVIVGGGESASGPEAFRWTAEGGMVGLGDLPGGSFNSNAYGVSADGALVVGEDRYDAGEGEAFIWHSANGMRSLQQVLTDLGLDLTGWTLTNAVGISADGLTIVGDGVNPSGYHEAWLAVIDRSCEDGLDNDGDGLIDYPNDPGCSSGIGIESPQCQDGLNNDNQVGIDFDGGASLDLDHDGLIDAAFNPAMPAVGWADPQCKSASQNKEANNTSCGLGFELALLLPPLLWLRTRRRRD